MWVVFDYKSVVAVVTSEVTARGLISEPDRYACRATQLDAREVAPLCEFLKFLKTDLFTCVGF